LRFTKTPNLEQQLEKMHRDWDARARENARYYIATSRTDWSEEEFFASGEKIIADDILTDMGNICQGEEPTSMRVLEIGCGTGRLTRALANLFGEVHAVDVSGEMIARARKALAEKTNAHVYQNNGRDLAVVPPIRVRFCVFQPCLPAHPQPRGDRVLCARSPPSAPPRRSVQVTGARQPGRDPPR